MPSTLIHELSEPAGFLIPDSPAGREKKILPGSDPVFYKL